MIPTSHHGQSTLPFGRFYGQADVRHCAPGLELSLMRADPHRVVERHSHEEAHFVLVLDGLYVSSAQGAPPVSAGTSLIFNPAGTTHRDRFAARRRVVDGKFLTISLSADIMREAGANARLPQHATVIDSAEALTTALELARACAMGGGDAPFAQHALSLELLLRTARDVAPDHRDPPAWLQVAREQLDDSLGQPCSITEVARVAGVHPVHLSRVFRAYVGHTPADYLRQRRLEQSRVLMQCTENTLSDIALTCGFTHQSHFSNAFRAAYGVSPSVFRAQLRG